jgi:hypothetical protein
VRPLSSEKDAERILFYEAPKAIRSKRSEAAITADMTLVIARRLRRTVAVCSDSKVTFLRGGRSSYVTGVLKAVIVDPYTCVGIAGNPYPGLKVLREFASRRTGVGGSALAGEAVVDFLREASSAVSGAAQFLVASLRPMGVAAVRGDRVEHGEQCWIGDCDAFEAFQRHFHEPSGMAMQAMAPETFDRERLAAIAATRAATLISGLREAGYHDEDTIQDIALWTRVTDAMQDVIADPTVESVGEFAIAVTAGAGGFQYVPFGFTSSGFETGSTGEVSTAHVGTTAGGDFTYSICVPPTTGVGAIGVHFREARLGALFHPLIADEPFKYRDVDERAFLAAIEHDHGIELRGGVLA